MTNSFKDIYEKDKIIPEKIRASEGKSNDIDKNIRTVLTADVEKVSPTMTVLDGGVNKSPPNLRLEEAVKDMTSDIKNLLIEQREQSNKMIEAIVETNTKIANTVTKISKNSAAAKIIAAAVSNEQLAEAIVSLTEQVKALESKLDTLKDLEIPTPIVNVQIPNKTRRDVHRDKKGLITHISETEVTDREESEDKDE